MTFDRASNIAIGVFLLAFVALIGATIHAHDVDMKRIVAEQIENDDAIMAFLASKLPLTVLGVTPKSLAVRHATIILRNTDGVIRVFSGSPIVDALASHKPGDTIP